MLVMSGAEITFSGGRAQDTAIFSLRFASRECVPLAIIISG